MTKGYNLWLEWEAYKMCHPEERQVLEWQEQDYSRFCGRSQNRGEKEGEKKMAEVKYPWVVVEVGDGYTVARNGRDGIPEVGYHYYLERQDAEEDAEWRNDNEEEE